MKKILIPAIMLIVNSLSIPSVNACALMMEVSYLNKDGDYIRSVDRKSLWKIFIKKSTDLHSPYVFRDGLDSRDAQIHDFRNAVIRHFPNMNKSQQKKMVETWKAFLVDYYGGVKDTFTGYPDFPEELQEFRLYLQGFDELKQNRSAKPESWFKLLALPPKKRFYRTVWVHYILGNWDKKNLHTHAANCRKSAVSGFYDSAGLAWGTYKQEVRYGTDPVKIIHAMLEGYRCNPQFSMLDYFSYYNQKYGSFQSLLRKFSDKDYQKIMEDPIGREFALFFDVESNRFEKQSKNVKFRNMDYLAYHYWMKGQVEKARKSLSCYKKDSLLSLYLGAEIDLYDGNREAAEKKLWQWLEMRKNTSAEMEIKITFLSSYGNGLDNDIYGTSFWFRDVYGKLGAIMAARKEYKKAAECFFYAGREMTDFPAIADIHLSLRELCDLSDKFLKEFPNKLEEEDDKNLPYEFARRVAHLTARRAFREGKYDIARKYLPEEYKKFLDSYLGYIAFSRDYGNGADQRALALYNAAKIMRYKGLELCGTEYAPDNYRFAGNFFSEEENPVFSLDYTSCNCSFKRGIWVLCGKHAAIVRKHAPGFLLSKYVLSVLPHERWHYRVRAADLALSAGEIAEDQELRALIHLFGGRCCGGWDIFYKRLVLRSRKTKLSKVADKKRWFPVIEPLQKEILRVEPLPSLEAVKKLMKEAFPKNKKKK